MSSLLRSVKLFFKNITMYGNKSDSEKNMTKTGLFQNFGKIFTIRRLIIYSLVSNFIGIAYYVSKYNVDSYNLSYSRFISRTTGRVMNITVPTFLRSTVYGFYMKLYNVNREEIEEQDLTKYRSLKDFFIRKIKVLYYLLYNI